MERRSQSATPLSPTCLRRAARSLRRDGSFGSFSINEQTQPIASYQNPMSALVRTLSGSQVRITEVTVRHSLNSHRSIIPPATISLEGDSGLGLADTNQRYWTFGSSVSPRLLRSMDWTPASIGVEMEPS